MNLYKTIHFFMFMRVSVIENIQAYLEKTRKKISSPVLLLSRCGWKFNRRAKIQKHIHRCEYHNCCIYATEFVRVFV